MKKVIRSVNDLGVAAYCLMYGFKPTGKNGRDFLFEITEEELPEFDRKKLEYLSSDFHRFDSYIMSLKKMS